MKAPFRKKTRKVASVFFAVFYIFTLYTGASGECSFPSSYTSTAWFQSYFRTPSSGSQWFYTVYSNSSIVNSRNDNATLNTIIYTCVSSVTSEDMIYFIYTNAILQYTFCAQSDIFSDPTTGARALFIEEIVVDNAMTDASLCQPMFTESCLGANGQRPTCSAVWNPATPLGRSPMFTPSICPFQGSYQLSVTYEGSAECTGNLASIATVTGSQIVLSACDTQTARSSYKNQTLFNQTLTCLGDLGGGVLNPTQLADGVSVMLFQAADNYTIYCARYNISTDGQTVQISIDVNEAIYASCAYGSYNTASSIAPRFLLLSLTNLISTTPQSRTGTSAASTAISNTAVNLFATNATSTAINSTSSNIATSNGTSSNVVTSSVVATTIGIAAQATSTPIITTTVRTTAGATTTAATQTNTAVIQTTTAAMQTTTAAVQTTTAAMNSTTATVQSTTAAATTTVRIIPITTLTSTASVTSSSSNIISGSSSGPAVISTQSGAASSLSATLTATSIAGINTGVLAGSTTSSGSGMASTSGEGSSGSGTTRPIFDITGGGAESTPVSESHSAANRRLMAIILGVTGAIMLLAAIVGLIICGCMARLRQATPSPVRVVEKPVVVEKPLIVEQPIVIEKPMVERQVIRITEPTIQMYKQPSNVYVPPPRLSNEYGYSPGIFDSPFKHGNSPAMRYSQGYQYGGPALGNNYFMIGSTIPTD